MKSISIIFWQGWDCRPFPRTRGAATFQKVGAQNLNGTLFKVLDIYFFLSQTGTFYHFQKSGGRVPSAPVPTHMPRTCASYACGKKLDIWSLGPLIAWGKVCIFWSFSCTSIHHLISPSFWWWKIITVWVMYHDMLERSNKLSKDNKRNKESWLRPHKGKLTMPFMKTAVLLYIRPKICRYTRLTAATLLSPRRTSVRITPLCGGPSLRKIPGPFNWRTCLRSQMAKDYKDYSPLENI